MNAEPRESCSECCGTGYVGDADDTYVCPCSRPGQCPICGSPGAPGTICRYRPVRDDDLGPQPEAHTTAMREPAP